jgi:hypothetical protein
LNILIAAKLLFLRENLFTIRDSVGCFPSQPDTIWNSHAHQVVAYQVQPGGFRDQSKYFVNAGLVSHHVLRHRPRPAVEGF